MGSPFGACHRPITPHFCPPRVIPSCCQRDCDCTLGIYSTAASGFDTWASKHPHTPRRPSPIQHPRMPMQGLSLSTMCNHIHRCSILHQKPCISTACLALRNRLCYLASRIP